MRVILYDCQLDDMKKQVELWEREKKRFGMRWVNQSAYSA